MTDVPSHIPRNSGALGLLLAEERRRRQKRLTLKLDRPALLIVWGLEESAPRAFLAESRPGDRQRLEDWLTANAGRHDVLNSLLSFCGCLSADE